MLLKLCGGDGGGGGGGGGDGGGGGGGGGKVVVVGHRRAQCSITIWVRTTLIRANLAQSVTIRDHEERKCR